MNNIKWNFKGKNVLVVGSSRGIGKGVYDEFKRSGANVIGLESKYCDLRYKEEIEKTKRAELAEKKASIFKDFLNKI